MVAHKENFSTVFIVLTYRNAHDLNNFFNSLHDNIIDDYKVIVVNSYYDDNSKKEIESVTIKNNGVFINTENLGYGHGNNIGIKYAIDNFIYKIIIVCNPDIELVKFDEHVFGYLEPAIFAPDIIRDDGRHQNPMRVNYSRLSDKLSYYGFRLRQKVLVYMGIALTKFDRLLYEKKCKTIYEAHGSFVVFTKSSIKKLYPVFDEKIFLFCEESDLGQRCIKERIPIYYDRKMVIKHHEDGSMKLSNLDLNGIMRKSFIYYYEKWFK